ncbi:TPA: YccF domain-containing protein [Enterococcus faecalis]|nr:YccF domain-containing protein [Enterococcus faecalis]
MKSAPLSLVSSLYHETASSSFNELATLQYCLKQKEAFVVYLLTYIIFNEESRGTRMKTLGNILWFIFGGFFGGLSWLFAGVIWCITIIGIPIGLQCFKLAGLSFWPFKKRVVYSDSGVSLVVNIIWLIISGLPLAIGHCISGLLLCLTIIGIPFGQQSFKLAKLALMPFGARVVSTNDFYFE